MHTHEMNSLEEFRYQIERSWHDNAMEADMSNKSAQCFKKIFSQSINVQKCLSDIARNGQDLDAIRNRSYSHPIGFRKYNLFHSKVLRGTIRFHVWCSAKTPVEAVDDIHTHRWNFYSYILSGCFRFDEFCRSENGSELISFVCSENRNGHYKMMPDKRVKIVAAKTYAISQGEAYCFSNKQIHKVATDMELTKTLVLELDTKNQSSRVYRAQKLNAIEAERDIPLEVAIQDFNIDNQGQII